MRIDAGASEVQAFEMRMMLGGLFAMVTGISVLSAADGEFAPPEGFVEVDLWTGVPPGTPAGDVPKENTSDPARVAQVNRPRIWLSLPEGKKGAPPATCVLLVPGGGYGIVSMRYEGTEVAKYLRERGIASAVLIYRCKPQTYPAPLLDARKALSILHERAGEWGIDAGKLGVMGFSAGGHLAGLLCSAAETEPKSADGPRPAFGVFLYPVVRLLGNGSHSGSGVNLLGKERVEKEAEKFALDRLVDDQWPRSYGIHEKDDPVVPVAGVEALAAAVRARGIPMELRIEEGKVHGFGWNRPGSKENPRPTSDWLPKVTDWILSGDTSRKP